MHEKVAKLVIEQATVIFNLLAPTFNSVVLQGQ